MNTEIRPLDITTLREGYDYLLPVFEVTDKGVTYAIDPKSGDGNLEVLRLRFYDGEPGAGGNILIKGVAVESVLVACMRHLKDQQPTSGNVQEAALLIAGAIAALAGPAAEKTLCGYPIDTTLKEDPVRSKRLDDTLFNNESLRYPPKM